MIFGPLYIHRKREIVVRAELIEAELMPPKGVD